MMNEACAIIKAIKRISEVFGFDYVKKHKNAPICKSVKNNVLTLSYLFQDNVERPDLKPNYLGWTVYATVTVDMETGDVKIIDYVLPNGEKR